MRLATLFLIACVLLTSCGGTGDLYNSNVPTGMPPYIGSVVPASASPGDTVVISGFGYSVVAPMNLVSFGSNSATATAYTPNPGAVSAAIESLTVTVPAGSTAGVVSLFVTVYGNTSNSIDFTINP